MDELQRATRVVITDGAGFDRPFVLSNLAATVIACGGLLANSAATIIGAMLVATLMGPIMGIGLALPRVAGARRRRSDGARRERAVRSAGATGTPEL